MKISLGLISHKQKKITSLYFHSGSGILLHVKVMTSSILVPRVGAEVSEPDVQHLIKMNCAFSFVSHVSKTRDDHN